MKRLTLFFLISLICCPAFAKSEAPKLTPAVQKVVYTAQQAMEKKDYLEAEECLKKFIEKNPKKHHYLVEFTLANIIAMRGRNEEALPHYKVVVELYPDYAPAWQNMGKVYFDLKQYEEAGDCLFKGYELNEKKDPPLLYHVAVCYIMAKKLRKALPHLEYLTSGKAGTPKTEWFEALLKVCMDLHIKGKVFKVITRLLDKNGNDPRWWKILAQFHLQQSDYKNAVATLTVYSYLTPLKKQEIMLLGDLYNAVGVPLNAAECYEKALCIENNPATYERLASAYIASHKPAKAIDTLNKALGGETTSMLWFMMGQALYGQGEFRKAYDAFDQSARLGPEDGRAYLMMGYCALHLDKRDKAKMAFRKATHFPKQRKRAKESLRQVNSINKR